MILNEIKMECRCDYCHSIWSYQEEDIEKVDYDAKGIYFPQVRLFVVFLS